MTIKAFLIECSLLSINFASQELENMSTVSDVVLFIYILDH